MDGTKKSPSDPNAVAIYRVRLRTKDGREAVSAIAVEQPDPVDPSMASADPGLLPPQLYRFKVRTADGRETYSKIVTTRPKAADGDLLANPRWDAKAFAHGGAATVSVDAPGLDGKKVRFVVERREKGAWIKAAEHVFPVVDGKAQGTIRAEHPKKERGPAVQMRFRAQVLREG